MASKIARLDTIKSRAPHGARGLKSAAVADRGGRRVSRPTRGAWIEILSNSAVKKIASVAPHTGRVD